MNELISSKVLLVYHIANCNRHYCIIAPSIPSFPRNTRISQALPRQSVEGRSRSIIIPIQHLRTPVCHYRLDSSVDRSAHASWRRPILRSTIWFRICNNTYQFSKIKDEEVKKLFVYKEKNRLFSKSIYKILITLIHFQKILFQVLYPFLYT